MNKSGSSRINLHCLHLNLIISFVKKIFHLNLTFAVCRQPYKGIQDSLGFWIPRRVFRILGTGFQYLSVKLGFWILIVRAIPDSLSGIPDSQPRIPDSTFKFFPDSGFHKRKNEGKFSVNIAPNLSTELISLRDPACKAHLGYNNVTRGMGRKNLRKRFHFCLRRIS